MSGPKRAEVETQLRVARNGQKKCATLIADSKRRALLHLLATADKLESEALRSSREASQLLDGLSPEIRSAAGSSLHELASIVSNAAQQAQETGSRREQIRSLLDHSDNQTRSADATYTRATRTLDEAEAALQRSGNHYLRAEMDQAQGATRLFDQAARELDEAARTRQQATQSASEAVQHAEEATSTARSAVQRAKTLRAEAQKRIAAEAEARRIAEQKRREATLALDHARGAVDSLRDLPHQKFRPGGLDELEQLISAAQKQLGNQAWDECGRQAQTIEKRSRQVASEVGEALREYERRRAESEAHLQTLLATIDGADANRVAQWADTPNAYIEAQQSAQSARQAISREAWSEANALADSAQTRLAEAIETASQNQSRDEVRIVIGEAVMDVLEELHFDVSSAPGSRTEPLRIKGLTPDAKGRGDFAVSIPLSGEVDFHIESPDGDVSCVAAVRELQQRLAARGVEWNTTDWGHATDAAREVGKVKTHGKQQEKQTVKIQTR